MIYLPFCWKVGTCLCADASPGMFVCVGLLQKKMQSGAQTTMEATLMSQQTPAQREKV